MNVPEFDNKPIREQYRSLRYEYYHAGRLLYMVGNMQSAGIMLGYTAETIMKAALSEILPEDKLLKSKIINSSHDIKRILLECQKNKLFEAIRISDDFLDQIWYYFQRYPSQQRKTLRSAAKENKAIANSIDWIHYYDDFIVQLDYLYYLMTRDPLVSIICLAIQSSETNTSRDILRHNAHALMHYEEFSKAIIDNYKGNLEIKKMLEENISKGIEYYWGDGESKNSIIGQIEDTIKKYKAEKFVLPRYIIKDGFWQVCIK